MEMRLRIAERSHTERLQRRQRGAKSEALEGDSSMAMLRECLFGDRYLIYWVLAGTTWSETIKGLLVCRA